MTSMTMATLGWAVIWTSLCLKRWAPDWAPDPGLSFAIASGAAVVGLFFGLFSLRAKLAWILITAAPIFANTSLLCLRWVVPDLLTHKQNVELTETHAAAALTLSTHTRSHHASGVAQ